MAHLVTLMVTLMVTVTAASDCELRPSPAPSVPSPPVRPVKPACARSCLQLRDRENPLPDGIYWLTDFPVPVYCDFSHDDGGWMLLLTAVSQSGWDVLAALSRNIFTPSLTDNYSILYHADKIRLLGKGPRFAYRIETQAEKGRQRWGGIWLSDRENSLINEGPTRSSTTQGTVKLVRQFNRWGYGFYSIGKCMPWLYTHTYDDEVDPRVLTTGCGTDIWGVMVSQHFTTKYKHSPWIQGKATSSGTVLYWLREEIV